MLLSIWLLISLGAATVAVAGRWVFAEWHWAHTGLPPRRRWSWRVAATVVCLCLGTASMAEAFNLRYAYIADPLALLGSVSPDMRSLPVAVQVPVSTVVAGPIRGFVEEVRLGDPRPGSGGRPAYVYLPPQYFDPGWSSVRFPVLYLLPGFPGTVADWLRSGHLDRAMDRQLGRGQIRPFIVVMSEFNTDVFHDSECQDLPHGPQVQTYLTVDLVRAVDARYRTVPDRRGRAIGGLSTGGYCAINLALRHQDVYSAFISNSGFARPDANPFTYDLFGGDPSRKRANTPTDYLPKLPVTRPFAGYLDVGLADSDSRRDSELVASTLRSKGVPVELRVVPNAGHTWSTWRRSLYHSLPWLSYWFALEGVAPGTGSGPSAPGLPVEVRPAPIPSSGPLGGMRRLPAARPSAADLTGQ